MIVKKIDLMPSSFSGPKTRPMIGWKVGACRKLTPTVSIRRAACWGVGSMLMPSASRTSALPEDDEMDRLPCLATFTPPDADRIAFAELTLKVVSPPPVPQVSDSSPSTSTLNGTATRRMASAIAATSEVVGPLFVRPTRNPAIWTSDNSPAAMAFTTEKSSARSRLKLSESFARIGAMAFRPRVSCI